MYNGVKRKKQTTKPKKAVTKFQVLQQEEVEQNGIITKQLVFKTKEYKQDKSIKWKDFEIANLIAAGINPTTLPTTILEADIETLHAKAAQAEAKLDRYEIEQEIMMEEQIYEPTTEQTQQ